jgi:hypothetical protein
MMMTMIKSCFTLLLLISIHRLHAQHTDVAAWLHAGLTVDLPKKFTVQIAEEVRRNLETADTYGYYTSIGLQYRWKKNFFTQAEYRLRLANANNATAHRIAFSITYKNVLGDFDWAVKSKIQYDIKPDNFETSAWRNKLTLKYDVLKDIKPYISYETAYALSFSGNTFNNIRPEMGCDFQLNKKNEFTLYWLFDKTFHESYPQNFYVFGLQYKFTYKL